MALRNIVKVGDKVLNKVCRSVQNYDERLHVLLDDMRDTLEDAEGLGLAGPQVGILRRVAIVLDITKEGLSFDEQIVELINPRIVYKEGEQTGNEGCLSLPGQFGVVTRPMKVTVKAFDRYGKEFEYTGEGITARAFCHELDHLDGHLFTEIAEHMLTPEELEALEG